MRGWVYVISNEFIPCVVKVGRTKDTPAVRIKDFERASAAPGQYGVEYAALVTDYITIEQQVHAKLSQTGSEYNPEYHKEWFIVSGKVAAEAIKTTLNEVYGVGFLGEMGFILRNEHDEPFEYICFKCKAKCSESNAVLSSLTAEKKDGRKKSIDEHICIDCFERNETT